MERDDYVLCVYDDTYRYVARVIAKHENRQFAQALWGETEAGNSWQYLYFLTKPIKVDRPVVEVAHYLSPKHRGFTKIPDKKLDVILDEYGSVDHFVCRMFEVQFDGGAASGRRRACRRRTGVPGSCRRICTR